MSQRRDEAVPDGAQNAPETPAAASHRDRTALKVALFGFAGALMIAEWAWTDTTPTSGTVSMNQVLARLVGALGVIVLSGSWLATRGWRTPQLWRVLAVWALPLMVCPPVMSSDGWAYAAQGYLLANGFNPYEVPQGRAGDLGALVDSHWRGSTAVYPPGSLWGQAGAVALSGGRPLATIITLRMVAVAALILLGMAVTRVARLAGVDEHRAFWVAVVNPLTVLQVVGGVHNDGMQAAIGVWALVVAWTLARRGQYWWAAIGGGALVGLAGTVKQPGVLFGLGVVAVIWAQLCNALAPGDGSQGEGARQRRGRGGRSRRGAPRAATSRSRAARSGGARKSSARASTSPAADGRTARPARWARLIALLAVAAMCGVGVFAAVSSIAGLGLGWLNPSGGNPVSVTSDAPIALVVQMLGWAGVSVQQMTSVATAVSLSLTGIGIMWCWVEWGPTDSRAGDPLRFQAAALVVYLVCSVALQPWYLVGLVAIVALMELSSRCWEMTVTVILAATTLSFLQWFCSPFLALPIVVLGAFFVWRVGARVGG
ncbi:carotene biosynthesis associated membrane protein [Cutibacterium granulosum]|uniref:Carotene biosynthesis associated membrane protein n=2 Tax=Cutibacterium granulosum TaxID=33011 RepID=A0A239WZG7_9ACTN|nr:polyprenol phosphomannose-dependent alpha 1,6 mannosyltransferase MptB [Cutibacterium granulosum]KAG9060200.1 polyprenol phosphomannose-dependent alpha 1,6 mannosyltransferase MptB [Cutibacterium granulosum DSM 20700]SNV39905.1 carotene biosynthesis associated membrane protein [Cutibacterium granulosum]